MDFWRPREFRFIQELCPMEPVKLPKFTSGRRDLNPGPLPPQGSALPGCATARMNIKSYPLFQQPESLNCRLPSEAWAKEGRDFRPLKPTPTQSGMPLHGLKKNCAARRICAPHTLPSALQFPLRVRGLGCSRTRAMNRAPSTKASRSEPPVLRLPRFRSGLRPV